jgi:NAD(P)-dependent dehydrogenase (short-subunit alcohol dehydrogenase family)
MSDWTGKVVAVTGGASGLGAAMAASFAEIGMQVVVLDLDAEAAEATAIGMRAMGGKAIARSVDVRDRRSLDAAVETTRARFGRCDVVFANAGVVNFGLLERSTDADWQWMFEVNVFGVVRTVNAFLPLLRETPGNRHIVITSSTAALAPGVRLGVYSASKFAVSAYAEVLRLELAGENIGVSAILPGSMNTRLLETSAAAFPAELGPHGSLTDDLAVVAQNPVGEVLTPEEAAAHVLPQIFANEPMIVTHGEHWREMFRERVLSVEEAFDRMVAARTGEGVKSLS